MPNGATRSFGPAIVILTINEGGKVFGLLPKVDGPVANNYTSALVVSLLGGYSGIKAFDLVLKRLGWAT